MSTPRLTESIDRVAALIEKARAEEREACAKICDDYHAKLSSPAWRVAAAIGHAIRARGDK